MDSDHNIEKKAKKLLDSELPVMAQAAALIGILEELKTVTHILASIYIKMPTPEAVSEPMSQSAQPAFSKRPTPWKSNVSEPRKMVFYILQRRPDEYQIMHCLQGDDPMRGYSSWHLIWKTFWTLDAANQFIEGRTTK